MIVVTGANGRLGSAVIENLLARTNPENIAASVREPKKVHQLKQRGVEVRHGNYDEPDTMIQAFRGAERVLIISASSIAYEPRVIQHRNAIDAAVQANVGHVYYTSLIPGDDSVTHVIKAHAFTEHYLRSAGIPFTILRNGIYTDSYELYTGSLDRDTLDIPADGSLAWVSRADLAEGIAELLIAGDHKGKTLSLTGPAALNIAEVAQIASRYFNRQIVARIVGLDEYFRAQCAVGKDPDLALQWATTFYGMARDEFATIDPFLGQLLDRPLRTFEQEFKSLVNTLH